MTVEVRTHRSVNEKFFGRNEVKSSKTPPAQDKVRIPTNMGALEMYIEQADSQAIESVVYAIISTPSQ